MAVVLRRNTGTALTFDQLDDNFVDYTTFQVISLNQRMDWQWRC